MTDALPTVAAAAENAIIGDLAVPYALIATANRSIGGIIPDVTVREVLVDEDTITIFPVESGTPISDHVFANPKLVEIECGFSDSTAGYPGYVQAVYEQFLALRATRQPFDVYTGKRAYQNMLIRNLTVVTDETSEFALMVTIALQEVIITSTGAGTIGAGTSDPSLMPTVDMGTQTLQPSPNSVLSAYENGFGPTPGFSGSNI